MLQTYITLSLETHLFFSRIMKEHALFLGVGFPCQNAAWIEDNTPLKLDSIEEDLPEKLRGRTGKQGYLQLVPGKDSCDGFFLAKFKRPLEGS